MLENFCILVELYYREKDIINARKRRGFFQEQRPRKDKEGKQGFFIHFNKKQRAEAQNARKFGDLVG